MPSEQFLSPLFSLPADLSAAQLLALETTTVTDGLAQCQTAQGRSDVKP